MRSLALWFSIGLTAASCSAERRAIKKEEKAIEALSHAAGNYWQAVRWNYWDTAAGYYEDSDERLAWLTEQGTDPSYRYTSATLMRVEVEPLVEDPAEGEVTRRGRVYVQTQGYPLATQVVEQKVLDQRWLTRDEDAEVWFIESGQ